MRRLAPVYVICAFALATPLMADGLEMSNISVTTRGSEAGGEFCKDFELSADQVAEFFELARPVSTEELHSDYDELPCFVMGTAIWKSSNATWQIRAGGTGSITLAGERTQDFACKSQCDHLFVDQ